MAAEWSADVERDAVIAALTPVVDGLAATFGPLCEVVLHDYRRPEKSVVALAGSVTGREVGGAMSEIGLRIVARGDEAGDDLGYRTRTAAGKTVKSSTIVLRDSTGAVFGALCVNLDVGAITEAHTLLGALAGLAGGPAEPPAATTFGNDVDSVVDAILDAHHLRRDGTWAGLGRAERIDLFRSLDEHGVFAVRRAVEQVAARLAISRASAYSYLAQARATTDRAPGRTPGGTTTDRTPGGTTTAPAPGGTTTAPAPVGTTTAPASDGATTDRAPDGVPAVRTSDGPDGGDA